MVVTFSKRQNLFMKGNSEWRVEDDALAIRKPKAGEKRISWRDVARVRIAYAPVRGKSWRDTFVIYLKNGRKVEVDNVHFAGVGLFKDYSVAYAPFAKAALERIRALAPEAQAHTGQAPWSYWGNILFVTLAFLFLAVVLFVVPKPLDYLGSASMFVRILIIVILIPPFLKWIRRARPRDTTLDDIPDDALPKLGAE